MSTPRLNEEAITAAAVASTPPPIQRTYSTEAVSARISYKTSVTTPIPMESDVEINSDARLQCIVHELKTPLQTISRCTALLKMSIKPSQSEPVQDIEASVAHMNTILNHFFVVEDHRIKLNDCQWCNILELLDSVQIVLRHQLDDYNIQLSIKSSDMMDPYVWCDEVNIKHVLLNLVNNAIKYSSSTKPDKQIDIYVSNTPMSSVDMTATIADQKCMRISIVDHNEPIPATVKDRIFQKYNTTSGSGLGLYMCKLIVDLHHGELTHKYLHDQEGNKFTIFLNQSAPSFAQKMKGTTEVKGLQLFTSSTSPQLSPKPTLTPCSSLPTVTLPRRPSAPMPSSSHRTYRSVSLTSVPEEPHPHPGVELQILVVDDCKTIQRLMSHVIQSHDRCVVTTVDHGLAAVELVSQDVDRFHVILIDRYMPVMSGSDAVRKLREIQYHHLIFGVSGMVARDDDFYHCGLDAVLEKPLTARHIDRLLAFVVENGYQRNPGHHLVLLPDTQWELDGTDGNGKKPE